MKKILILSFTLMLLISQAYGFNNKKEGFILGVGGGYHHTGINQENISNKNFKGFASSVRAGVGITDKVLAYYIREASWFRVENLTQSKDIYISGISGIGVSYYIQNNKFNYPIYIIGALGLSDLANVSVISSIPDTGFGYLVGLGYEIKNHVSIEAKMMSTDIDVEFTNNDIKTKSFYVTLNYLWY